MRPLVHYRVELRHPSHEARILGLVTGVALHHSSLDQYVSRLLQEGVSGMVMLVDDESDIVVARRQVTRPKTRGTRTSTSGPIRLRNLSGLLPSTALNAA